MIYTVTFNPSLDYIVRADHFAVGEVNRTTYEQILEGGKGLQYPIQRTVNIGVQFNY